jgi:hypothetical protein
MLCDEQKQHRSSGNADSYNRIDAGARVADVVWEARGMMTLRQFAVQPETIPAKTSWYLADLGEARGKQELFTKQSP